MKVIFARTALNDLDEIGEFIAQDSPGRAASFIAQIKTSAKGLGRFPRRFPLIERYEHTGIRRRTHGRYLIFYQVEVSQVTVLRVIHAARDYQAQLFPDS